MKTIDEIIKELQECVDQLKDGPSRLKDLILDLSAMNIRAEYDDEDGYWAVYNDSLTNAMDDLSRLVDQLTKAGITITHNPVDGTLSYNNTQLDTLIAALGEKNIHVSRDVFGMWIIKT